MYSCNRADCRITTTGACWRCGRGLPLNTTIPAYQAPHQGCICPPTSEQTCQNPYCPRKDVSKPKTTKQDEDKMRKTLEEFAKRGNWITHSDGVAWNSNSTCPWKLAREALGIRNDE